ncbi:hypothetical protein Tco_0606706 [Tanacetum coccineum]
MNLQDQGYVESGCSMHMTWNMPYLLNFKEFDGGYVTFGEEPKREISTVSSGKESSNPLMADSLPKTIVPTKLVKPQGFNLRPHMEIAKLKKWRLKKLEKEDKEIRTHGLEKIIQGWVLLQE